MPKKRKSTESDNYEQTNGVSQAHSQIESNAKSLKLDLLSNTTLQDLPMELHECILVKVVATEVMGMKLAKRVWTEKADLVISRLGTVCSQWSNILSTKSFRIKLHRILDGTAQEFRLEVVQQASCSFDARAVTYLGDDTFLLYEINELDRFKRECVINVYNRGNMDEVKQVIPLPGKDPAFMTGCCVSNCVYIALVQRNPRSFSILRISKDEEHGQYVISPWESDHRRSVCMMCVTANGSVVICDTYSDAVSIYNGSGSLQREVILSSPLEDVHKYVGILLKSSGNIILAYVSDENYLTQLLEIDMSGIVVRRFESAYSEESIVTFADSHDRILISPPFEEFELVDSEFNLVGVYSLQQDVGNNFFLFDWHFESWRNEVVRIHYDRIQMTNGLTRYRLTEQ